MIFGKTLEELLWSWRLTTKLFENNENKFHEFFSVWNLKIPALFEVIMVSRFVKKKAVRHG